jgi:hypothetical protein
MTDINYSRLSVRKFKEPTKPQPEIKIEFEPDMNLE